jgi:excisionase family DNA binding protein
LANRQLIGEWVSPQEAAEYLGVSKQTVLAKCKNRELVYSKLGYRTIRIKTVSLEKMLERSKE